jgi:CubicO group peptidase (beta-lactamase class C family)
MKQKSMDEVEKILIGQVKNNKTPSVQYLFFDRESVIKRFSYGYADIESRTEVNNKTTYNAYSVTKTFTALAILKLAGQDKLRLDHPVNRYLPSIPYNSGITIRNLLTHTAGIPNPVPLSWVHLKEEHKSFNRNQFFKEIFNKNNKIKSGPNEKYSYSNLGYVLLGQLIETISGKAYEEYIDDNIIKLIDVRPEDLGFEMDDTGRHAKGYHKRLSLSNLILGFFIDRTKYFEKSEDKWTPFRSFYVNGTSYGGLTGTPDAFVKYVQELLKPNCRLLVSDLKKLLFIENYTNNYKPTGMCFSWFRGELNGKKYFTHAGGGGGYYSEVRIYPLLNMGSVVFFNRTGMKDERFLDNVDKYYIQ